MKCSNCGAPGHNTRSCKTTISEAARQKLLASRKKKVYKYHKKYYKDYSFPKKVGEDINKIYSYFKKAAKKRIKKLIDFGYFPTCSSEDAAQAAVQAYLERGTTIPYSYRAVDAEIINSCNISRIKNQLTSVKKFLEGTEYPHLFKKEKVKKIKKSYRDIFKDSLAVENIKKAIETLDYRERRIIEMRFFEDKTLEEIGKEFNITRERVRQLEQLILERLRHPNRSKYLPEPEDIWVENPP